MLQSAAFHWVVADSGGEKEGQSLNLNRSLLNFKDSALGLNNSYKFLFTDGAVISILFDSKYVRTGI